jgi:hypothetical protein
MVAGIEAAALILREFPSLIQDMTALLDSQRTRTSSDFRWLRRNIRELKVEFALFEDSIERLWGEARNTEYVNGGITGLMEGDVHCWRESGVDFMLAKHMGQGSSATLSSNE